jgi:hypothetical protein
MDKLQANDNIKSDLKIENGFITVGIEKRKENDLMQMVKKAELGNIIISIQTPFNKKQNFLEMLWLEIKNSMMIDH